METIQYDCEVTDTFAGEANYSWVRRETVTLPEGTTQKARTRAIKRALGLSGVRGRSEWGGDDSWTFRPHGQCVVAFANFVY
jgi:hypothetical protein